jgi:hypothetical protein
MHATPQYSLAYLFLIVFWTALALGLWRITPRDLYSPCSPSPEKVMHVLILASLGAAAGGLLRRMRVGAAIGAGAVVCWYTLWCGIEKMFEWMFPL